jgi:hypothetical protein
VVLAQLHLLYLQAALEQRFRPGILAGCLAQAGEGVELFRDAQVGRPEQFLRQPKGALLLLDRLVQLSVPPQLLGPFHCRLQCGLVGVRPHGPQRREAQQQCDKKEGKPFAQEDRHGGPFPRNASG